MKRAAKAFSLRPGVSRCALLVISALVVFPLRGVVAGITPIKSTVTLTAQANAGVGLVQSNQLVSQTTSLNGLSASVFAQAVNGSRQATVQSSASATWTSASTGQFSLNDQFTSDDLTAYTNSTVATASRIWDYSFSSDLPATLTLNYAITFQGTFPQAMQLDLNQVIDGNTVGTIHFAVPSSGSLTFSINPGQTNRFQVLDNSNLTFLPAFSSQTTASFSYDITPVPEPSTLALAALAVAALLVLRSRNSPMRSHERCAFNSLPRIPFGVER